MQYEFIKICQIPIKILMISGLIKILPIIKYKQYIEIMVIQNKKRLLATIELENILKTSFNNIKLILVKY